MDHVRAQTHPMCGRVSADIITVVLEHMLYNYNSGPEIAHIISMGQLYCILGYPYATYYKASLCS